MSFPLKAIFNIFMQLGKKAHKSLRLVNPDQVCSALSPLKAWLDFLKILFVFVYI